MALEFTVTSSPGYLWAKAGTMIAAVSNREAQSVRANCI
jgi:hypothetical protein